MENISNLKLSHIDEDIEQMINNVESCTYDELLMAEVGCCPEEYIDFFMIGKAIGKTMTDAEWDEYMEQDTEEDCANFLEPFYKRPNFRPVNEEELTEYRAFVLDMGVTAIGRDKGLFPRLEDEENEDDSEVDEKKKKSMIEFYREKLLKIGYEHAGYAYESLMERDEEYRQEVPDKYLPDGRPTAKALGDYMDEMWWEFGSEELEEMPEFKTLFKDLDFDSVSILYFDGYHKFVEEKGI